MESSSTVSGSTEGWIEVNVTSAANRWQMAPPTNQGLYMTVTNEEGEFTYKGCGVGDTLKIRHLLVQRSCPFSNNGYLIRKVLVFQQKVFFKIAASADLDEKFTYTSIYIYIYI